MGERQQQIYFERLVYQRLRYAAMDHSATSMTIREVVTYAEYLFAHPDRLAATVDAVDRTKRVRKGSHPAS